MFCYEYITKHYPKIRLFSYLSVILLLIYFLFVEREWHGICDATVFKSCSVSSTNEDLGKKKV